MDYRLEEAVRTADDLARVCTDADFYRGLLGTTAHFVDAVLTAARSGDISGVRTAIEALSQALGQAGHPGGLSVTRGLIPSGSPGPIPPPPRPYERLFLCPLRCCSRYWFPADHAGEEIPHCSASGMLMRERVL